MINNKFIIKFAELYPIGKFKYAPGTIASLFTCIIFFYLNTYFEIETLVLIFFIVFFYKPSINTKLFKIIWK